MSDEQRRKTQDLQAERERLIRAEDSLAAGPPPKPAHVFKASADRAGKTAAAELEYLRSQLETMSLDLAASRERTRVAETTAKEYAHAYQRTEQEHAESRRQVDSLCDELRYRVDCRHRVVKLERAVRDCEACNHVLNTLATFAPEPPSQCVDIVTKKVAQDFEAAKLENERLRKCLAEAERIAKAWRQDDNTECAACGYGGSEWWYHQQPGDGRPRCQNCHEVNTSKERDDIEVGGMAERLINTFGIEPEAV